MTEDRTQGCVAPAGGPIVPEPEQPTQRLDGEEKEARTMHVTVGKEAPDFEAAAYHEGGFKNIRLSDLRGKWVFLCFYPGDFTFV
jgi:peroxiredoxin (alkyl hydroperoxide reductase subunit C)